MRAAGLAAISAAALAPAAQAAPIGSHLLKTVSPAEADNHGVEDRADSHVAFAGGKKTLFSVGDERAQPWVTDGTRTGTQPLAEPGLVQEIQDATALGDKAVYLDNYEYAAMWVTDGTPNGTKKIIAGGEGADTGDSVEKMTVAGSSAYYVSREKEEPGSESSPVRGLFKTDGTGKGTRVQPTGVPERIDVTDVTTIGDDLLFSFNTISEFGQYQEAGVWKLDTATGAATQVSTTSDIPNLDHAVEAGGKVYFTTEDREVGGNRIWVSDGEAAGTKDLSEAPEQGRVTLMADDSTVFAVTSSEDGSHLSRITGTTLQRLENSPAFDAGKIGFTYPVVAGDSLYAAQNRALVKVGPTGAATVVRDFAKGDDSGGLSDPVAIDGKVYFAGWTEEFNNEPWISDGTDAGTQMIDDVADGRDGRVTNGDPSSFIPAGDHVAFVAWDGTSEGTDLYATGPDPDGEPAPPVRELEGPQFGGPEPTPTPTPAPPAPVVPNLLPPPGAVPTPAPAPSAPADSRAMPAKVATKIADVTKTKKSIVVDVSGGLQGSQGKRTKAECTGSVEIVVTATTKKGKGKAAKTTVKELETVKSKLKWIKNDCTFEGSITFPKKSVPAGAKVEATVNYLGSKTQQPKSGTPVKVDLG